mmetsp:Transcript_50340/g.100246  ORF Transcript_50340/g.100246 Transcript_50340/m.100246 type:complete len:499 (-) Transcript_50340:477-1973(-)|eukprot:CAMPEP_0174700134 /NCGR_PEP_ID=MMETSP1094-20130205/5176_1 /TAXON_ID=156173 /ORGANISM="Chrysochromulina brevifilum, Strain UTEX LB 985" /LENGTH=498 /DNA_ID=CAMNT_0015897569 /DNA_START=49 /DNA_END=1545 /DNA_ORIENTATION=+
MSRSPSPPLEWPGYDAESVDSDEWWVFIPSDTSLADSILEDALSDYEQHAREDAVLCIQAAARGHTAKRTVDAMRRRATPLSEMPSRPSYTRSKEWHRHKDSSVATICSIFGILIFCSKLLTAPTAPTAPSTPPLSLSLAHTSFLHTIEDEETLSIQFIQDESLTWHDIPLYCTGTISHALVLHPAILLEGITSIGVWFVYQAALPPSTSASPPVMLSSWLSTRTAPPAAPDLALTFHKMIVAPPPTTTSLYEGFLVLLALFYMYRFVSTIGLALEWLMTLPQKQPTVTAVAALLPTDMMQWATGVDGEHVFNRPGQHSAEGAVGTRAATMPVPLTPLPTVTQPATTQPVVTPVKLSWNAFQASVGKRGYTRTEISQQYNDYKVRYKAQHASPCTGSGGRAAASAADSATPTNLNAAFDKERALTWNKLQRLMGKRGFTKEQMSLLWAAHKEGPLNYQQFRTHCKGRGIERGIESALWAQLKLCRAQGVHLERVIRSA